MIPRNERNLSDLAALEIAKTQPDVKRIYRYDTLSEHNTAYIEFKDKEVYAVMVVRQTTKEELDERRRGESNQK